VIGLRDAWKSKLACVLACLLPSLITSALRVGDLFVRA
jgi:hypothetical protein